MITPATNRIRAIVIATLASAAFAAVAGQAATPSDPTPQTSGAHHWHHHGPGAHFMHVLKQLNLTPEQQTQIKGIVASAKPQFKALGASIRSNHEALEAAAPTDPGYPALVATEKANAANRIDQMHAVKTQIYAVLSAEQIKQIPQILAADKAKWRQRHSNLAPVASTSAPATSS